MKKKKNLTILILVLSGLLIFFLIAFLVIRARMSYRPGINSSDYEYIKIEVQSLDKSLSYGYVWVEDGQMKNDIKIAEISRYISLNSNKWQMESLEYPVGGYRNGTFWDGTKTTDITKSDFLFAIYVALDDNFGESYHINLVDKVLP